MKHTLTPDILLRSDNLLHTSPELMEWQVPVGQARLGSGQIKVLTLSHLKIFTLLFVSCPKTNKLALLSQLRQAPALASLASNQ